MRDAKRAAADVGHKDAKALLHWAGDPQGADPGLFATRLIKAIFAADDTNLELLRAGWPGLVAAVEVYRKDIDWIGTLRGIARAAGEDS